MTIRAVLFLGFGLVFGLWLFSGYGLARRLLEVERRAYAINARFTHSEELLFTVRSEILVGSIYLRDALLDTRPDTAGYYRAQLLETRQQIERAFQEYVPLGHSPAERQNWARLQLEIADYWNTLLPVADWEPGRKPAEARAFLRHQVLPKREVIIRISERIQVLNRQAFERQQAEIGRVYADMRRWLRWTSGLAVFLGLGVAFLVTRYAGRLEAHIRRQHAEVLQNRRDLQRLSSRLVYAQEEERRTIARELHDEIGQALTAVKLELTVASRNLSSSDKACQPVEMAQSIADEALQAVRDLSQLLHPAILDDLGLPAVLEWYLQGFSKRTGIRTELVQDRMQTRLAPEVEICAYRIVQEALTNVARHAQAAFCRLYLQGLPHTLLITVEDDGKGFDPRRLEGADAGRGLGLVGVRERVAGLGGTFHLESSPGKGTRLSVELPARPVPPETENAEATEAPAASESSLGEIH